MPEAADAPESLAPGARAVPAAGPSGAQVPPAAVASALCAARSAGEGLFVYLASSERRAEEIGRALRAVDPEAGAVVLPGWDCLPYDRASPSRELMGRRMSALRRLCRGQARILVTTAAALVQRVAPRRVIEEAVFAIEAGAPLDRDALARFAARTGYVADDRIDEPGEIAFFGEVIDVFPPDRVEPIRIGLRADHSVGDLRTYDPITQRTSEPLERCTLGAASELVVAQDDDILDRPPGAEHGLGAYYERLPSLFDILPDAQVAEDSLFGERLGETLEQIGEAFEAQRNFGVDTRLATAEAGRLYLTSKAVQAGLAQWTPRSLDVSRYAPITVVAGARNPGRAFCDLVEAQRAEGRRIVIGGQKQERAPLARALQRGLQIAPRPIQRWDDVALAQPGEVLGFEIDVDAGYVDKIGAVAVVAASDVLGGRVAARGTGREALSLEPELRPGDVVLHEDHGIGVLRELLSVDVEGQTRDTLRIEYHGGDSILAPVEDIGRIWRYGGEESAVTLDRLKGDGWIKRRATLSRHIDETAERLVALASARETMTCDPIVPPRQAYAKFAARFGYPETPDQAAAINAVLQDLASGRPMDRLVCGDVGFGKTEVALRAAAAVALSGRQVALCAPTTVLAKQHLQTFQRRFAGAGLKIEHLSRLVADRDAASARASIAAGDADIVIGTHALAGDKVSFADLGLMIIDEEQKFGSTMKDRLRALAANAHCLSLTATPIPRTMQAALAGVQSVSVIASPPARRRPIRTFVAPFDGASVRTALVREKRRGGQSFVVAPRIEDIPSLRDKLATVAPDLSVRIAHGALAADEVDTVMVDFAEGEGDVLLATSIIESGLDVPRANTMIVWRPEYFGLAQLHQLRGRVGRGRLQGVAYLLHEPDETLSEATRARLSTLEAFDRLGSGLAISTRDLDLRGGGDLMGEDQAGHMQMVGAALYHRLLERAVKLARGEEVADEATPVVDLGFQGFIPADHVPDAVTRLNLYARLARRLTVEEIDAFEEELEDRFGPMPDALSTLLQRARLMALTRAAGVREVHAGPRAIALVMGEEARRSAAAAALRGRAADMTVKDDRIILKVECGEAERAAAVERVLEAIAPQ